MSMLLLALALVTPAPTVANEGSWGDEVSCSVNVRALDSQGQARSARRVSASAAPVVVFRGKVSPNETDAPPLVFDVYSPRGQRYQVLLATPRVVTQGRGDRRVERTSRTREASMAVAGSSIVLTSMYGKWRVEPRLEGTDKPCGRPEFFTIRP